MWSKIRIEIFKSRLNPNFQSGLLALIFVDSFKIRSTVDWNDTITDTENQCGSCMALRWPTIVPDGSIGGRESMEPWDYPRAMGPSQGHGTILGPWDHLRAMGPSQGHGGPSDVIDGHRGPCVAYTSFHCLGLYVFDFKDILSSLFYLKKINLIFINALI